MMTQPVLEVQPDMPISSEITPTAVAAALSRFLKPQGIAAKVYVQAEQVHVVLESIDVPPQARMVDLVTKGLEALDLSGLAILGIHGQRQGEGLGWSAYVQPEAGSWVPTEAPAELPPELMQEGLVDQAKQGDVAAITAFVTQALSDRADIEIAVALEDTLLKITLQTSEFLDGPAFSSEFGKKLNPIGSPLVREVALYKRRTAESNPFLIKQMTLYAK
jgi:hypothetical protein